MVYQKQSKTISADSLVSNLMVTAKDSLPGHSPEMAIDGKEDTFWAASPYYSWWKADLKTVYEISHISLTTGSSDKTRFFIEYSEDNLNWEKLLDGASEQGTAPEEYEVSKNAQYIRVTFTYCSSGETVQIQDMKIYGRETTTSNQPFITRQAPNKFFADSYDKVEGFTEMTDATLPGGHEQQVVTGGKTGSYIVFQGIDFTEYGVDQMRGHFGLENTYEEKHVKLEIRVDHLHGEKIGEIILFKQWKVWSVLGCTLEHEDSSLLTGIHDVYLVVTESDDMQEVKLHWLAFVKKSPLPLPNKYPEMTPKKEVTDYKIYFGNLHSHTAFSDGEGVPETAYDYARYTAGLDFLGITEHSNLYDHGLDWDKSQKWKDIQRMAERKTENGSFLALYGSETTWYNQFGHMNTYNIDFFINTYETQYNDITKYYETVKKYPDSIQQWNHPWCCGNRHLDAFEPYDKELDHVMRLIEVNPEHPKDLGALYYYTMALDKGWHVSPAGSQDNHRRDWGTANNIRTAVLVEELTKENFFDSVRKNLVYFTSIPHLKIWFTMNQSLMGSRITYSDSLDFSIKVINDTETEHQLVKLEIVTEKGKVVHSESMNNEKQMYEFSLPCEYRYYFVKITQDDGALAVTSPIWVE